jgi:hypothetical protein
MRWLSLIIALICLLAPAGHAVAQVNDELAYESIQPARIKVGETALLRITSFGRLRDVTLPTISGLAFENLGRAEGFEFVNGLPVPAKFIQIRVTPQFTGVFTIPGLAPGAPAIGLEVVKGDEPNPYAFPSQRPAPPPVQTASLPKGTLLQAGGAAFIHLSLPARDIYVGEIVPVDIEIGLRPGIVTTLNGLPELKGGDFTFNNLSKEPERRSQSIDGSEFMVLTWHSVLSAVKPGDYSLSAQAPVTANISTLSAADRAVAARLVSPLLQSMYNGVTPKQITIDSAPAGLKILPLPTEGRPADFNGAVGEFQVSSDIEPTSASSGEPLTLRLHVTGRGNFDRVDSTMFNHLDHWRTYPAKSTFRPSDAIGNQGEKVFEQPLIAARLGEQSIPGLTFSYFNPSTRRYEQSQTPAIDVNIGASLASRSLQALAGAVDPKPDSSTGAAPGLHPNHPSPRTFVSDLRPLYFRPLFLILPTGLALLLAAGWLFMRPGTAERIPKGVAEALARLKASAQIDDTASFMNAARDLLVRTLAARWQTLPKQITIAELRTRMGARAEALEKLFTLADEMKYGSRPSGGVDYQHWLRVVRDYVTEGKG